MAVENSLLHQQIMLLSGQLAPVMDRIGRIHIDFSPHLLNSVDRYNDDINNQQRNGQENTERNRTHDPRRRSRLQNENNDESSDNDLSRIADNGSEQESNQESPQPEQDQNQNRGESSEIRNRLRSISSTISRIRSSINSMRTMIFDNLGRDDGFDLNASLNEVREEHKVVVNAQIPLIFSPGDIASVHNRLNRFISGLAIDQGSLDRMLDRQAMTGTTSEGLLENIANGNNNDRSSSSSSISSDNPRANNNDNSDENNEEDDNEEAQSDGEESNSGNNRINHHRSSGLFDLLELPEYDRTEFGIIGNNFGGFGDGPETIEFHIHTYMPNRPPLSTNTPSVAIPEVQRPLQDSQNLLHPLSNSSIPTPSRSPEPLTLVSTGVQTEGIRIRPDAISRAERVPRRATDEDQSGFNTNPFRRT